MSETIYSPLVSITNNPSGFSSFLFNTPPTVNLQFNCQSLNNLDRQIEKESQSNGVGPISIISSISLLDSSRGSLPQIQPFFISSSNLHFNTIQSPTNNPIFYINHTSLVHIRQSYSWTHEALCSEGSSQDLNLPLVSPQLPISHFLPPSPTFAFRNVSGDSNSTEAGKKSSSLPPFTENSNVPFPLSSVTSPISHSKKLSFGYYMSLSLPTLT